MIHSTIEINPAGRVQCAVLKRANKCIRTKERIEQTNVNKNLNYDGFSINT